MIAALVAGFLVGSLPTADLLGRRHGVDLRRHGSGNPGAANALRVGGRALAGRVLAVDLIKGATAAGVGWWWAGEGGAAAAAVAAIAGQVRNPWFRGRGGKGLAVAGGTMLVVWPTGITPVVAVMAMGTRIAGSAAGSLAGVAALLGSALLWASRDWPMAWGIAPDDVLVWYSIGVAVITTPKFVAGLTRTPPADS